MMATHTPLVVVLAGPNGAGKSTSAARLLREALAVEEFVNADTIALGLSAYRPEAAAVAAGRVMLERLHFLVRERRDFAFETTLAGRGHARWLRDLRAAGIASTWPSCRCRTPSWRWRGSPNGSGRADTISGRRRASALRGRSDEPVRTLLGRGG